MIYFLRQDKQLATQIPGNRLIWAFGCRKIGKFLLFLIYIIHLLYFNLLYEYKKKHYKALLESLKGVVGDEDLDINDIDIINSGIETLKKL